MKLALYLPNFRTSITVKELVDLTHLAEELDFDSVWTLDRVVVPETSDRQEMHAPFGFIEGMPKGMPVSSRGDFLQGPPLIPYLAAITEKVRLGVSVIVTPYRAPGVLAAEVATWDVLSGGRINVAVGAGWMQEEFDAASAGHIYERRGRHAVETIEIMEGAWTNEVFEYHGEFASFEKCGFGAKPIQKPFPPIFFGGLHLPKTTARRIAEYGLSGWIGIQDTPEAIAKFRSAIKDELGKIEGPSIDDIEMVSMLWFCITDEKTDQTDNGKLSNCMVGTAQQITDNLERYREAGLTMPLLWPPFVDVPTEKTMDDLRMLKHDILPKIG